MTGPVVVAGGGIGGLAAALCLARAGVETVLLEQAPAFAEVGAGVQLTPNASRILHRLGLGRPLAACASQPAGIEYRHWRTGQLVARWTFDGRWAAAGAPYYQLHRADLLRVLASAAARAPGVELRPGARVVGFSANGGGVRVALAGGGEPVAGAALIGADGIHSTVRGQLFGNAAPRSTGLAAWRALVPAPRLPSGCVRPWATVWWGPRRHFVHYPVRGGELVNCVGVVRFSGPGEVSESWSQRGQAQELKEHFAGWHRGVRMLTDAVAPESLHKWALLDRPPLQRWGTGPATLLGDAAHPMLPFVAQGAAMAVEDAAVLAASVAGGADAGAGDASVAVALRRYEASRLPRTARVQRLARGNARLFHLVGAAAWLRDRIAPAAARLALARLYAYNAPRAAQTAAGFGCGTEGHPSHARDARQAKG